MAKSHKKRTQTMTVRDSSIVECVEAWVEIGHELTKLNGLGELLSYISSPYNLISEFITEDYLNDFEDYEEDFDEYGDVLNNKIIKAGEDLRNRLLIYLVAERISYFYNKEKLQRGIKSGGIKGFFEAITKDKQDYLMLLDVFGVAHNTAKNRRNDPFKDTRGPAITVSEGEGIERRQYIYREPLNKNNTE